MLNRGSGIGNRGHGAGSISESTRQFIDAQLAQTRKRRNERETQLAAATRAGRAVARADAVEYEVLQQEYRDLLNKREEAMMAVNLERLQIGERFSVIDVATIPATPVFLNRAAINAGGAIAGLGVGALLIAVTTRRRSSPDDDTQPEA
jgi:uncharacterized protein involved in exopolysaccharide biosynthesis